MARDMNDKVSEVRSMSSKNKIKKGRNAFLAAWGHKKKRGCCSKGIKKLDFYTKQDRVEFKFDMHV